MIQFLFRGILRDRNRSTLPILVITLGVALTVLISCYITGILNDMVVMNANFTTGHVKIMTRAYAENMDQNPNDLALEGAKELMDSLKKAYPDMQWVARIHFGGLMDIPDTSGVTRAQGPIIGMAIDMLSGSNQEKERLNILKSMRRGHLPAKSMEALISEDFANRMNLNPGDAVTLFSSTMYGSMAFQNFTVAGTVRFGTSALDRGTMIIDINDARQALDMNDAAGEILGYFADGVYNDELARAIADGYNARYAGITDEYVPTMLRLKDQPNMSFIIDYIDKFTSILIMAFVVAMSIVLWNTGLLGGLRRYNEFGVRLALGEEKNHIYSTLLLEAAFIGIIGSVIGTIIGLSLSYLLQENGLDFSNAMKNATMMMPGVYRAIITPEAFYVGFIPGLFSMVLGTALSGIGIYKRKTAQLFKELEV
jgi:putative ABC transport system permease protein